MTSNYLKEIRVHASAKEAYWAITEGMHLWWTKPDTPMKSVGDRSKFTFPPGVSFWTFEATDLVPNNRVEMKCVEALHKHQGQPAEIETEWHGTKVVWLIEEHDGITTVSLEHQGLVPSLLCYDICQAGWDFFFTDSLKSYLNTGRGKPHEHLAE